MAPRRGLQEERREQLTRAAMHYIVRKGYDHVTLGDVCGKIHMSRSIANYYFKNKEELLVSVLERMISGSTESICAFFGLTEEPENDEALYRAIEETAGPLAADGGELGRDIYGAMPELGWERLAERFLKP